MKIRHIIDTDTRKELKIEIRLMHAAKRRLRKNPNYDPYILGLNLHKSRVKEITKNVKAVPWIALHPKDSTLLKISLRLFKRMFRPKYISVVLGWNPRYED